MSDIVKVEGPGATVDLTKIKEIEKLRGDITTVDVYSAPLLMREFTTACDILARAAHDVKNAITAANKVMVQEESKALLERAPLYFAGRDMGNVKDSMSLREKYIGLDQLYLAAVERRDALKALLKYIEDKMEFYKMDHYNVKATYDKLQFPRGGSPGMKIDDRGQE